MTVPYRVLFSNDTTNILTCKSPYNERAGLGLDPATGKPTYHPCGFDATKLEATVDETAVWMLMCTCSSRAWVGCPGGRAVTIPMPNTSGS